jgi:hypothetical protein
MRKAPISAAALCAALACAGAPALAVELLTNGNLETSVSPPGWTLSQSVTGMPGANVNATEQISFANEPAPAPGELGLFLRTFAGNQGTYAGQNKAINAILSQTVNASPNRTYTFTGHAFLASGYSGSMEFMDPLSPSDPEGTGTVLSPTETTFEMAFLDAASAVIGTPVTLDLRDELTRDAWATHTLMGVAPANAARVRVTAQALNMLENFGFQDVYFDNFALQRDGDASTINRLTNGNLNSVGEPNGYVITETPAGADTVGFRDFANHTPGGEQGMWLRSFENGDGIMSQTVPAVVGGNYTFSAWAAWQLGYSGDSGQFPGTATKTSIELAFLNGSGTVIGTPVSLELDAAGMDNDVDGTDQIEPEDWRQFSVNGVAPAGAASVRVSASGVGMFDTSVNPQSAFFDDFSLTLAGSPGDQDGNGIVDGNDFLLIQRGLGSTTTPATLQEWKDNFGAGAAGAVAGTVPEPATLIVAASAALAGALAARRRRP